MALIPAFSIIAAVTSGFLSKCCPSEWWSSTPAWRYGAAAPDGAARCSGFLSRPTFGMSELKASTVDGTSIQPGSLCERTQRSGPSYHPEPEMGFVATTQEPEMGLRERVGLRGPCLETLHS